MNNNLFDTTNPLGIPDEDALQEFHLILENHLANISYHLSLDNLIKAAYTYRKSTKHKICAYIHDRKHMLIGYKMDDGHFIVGNVFTMRGGLRNLYLDIKAANISIIDFVNKQMMVFL